MDSGNENNDIEVIKEFLRKNKKKDDDIDYDQSFDAIATAIQGVDNKNRDQLTSYTNSIFSTMKDSIQESEGNNNKNGVETAIVALDILSHASKIVGLACAVTCPPVTIVTAILVPTCGIIGVLLKAGFQDTQAETVRMTNVIGHALSASRLKQLRVKAAGKMKILREEEELVNSYFEAPEKIEEADRDHHIRPTRMSGLDMIGFLGEFSELITQEFGTVESTVAESVAALIKVYAHLAFRTCCHLLKLAMLQATDRESSNIAEITLGQAERLRNDTETNLKKLIRIFGAPKQGQNLPLTLVKLRLNEKVELQYIELMCGKSFEGDLVSFFNMHNFQYLAASEVDAGKGTVTLHTNRSETSNDIPGACKFLLFKKKDECQIFSLNAIGYVGGPAVKGVLGVIGKKRSSAEVRVVHESSNSLICNWGMDSKDSKGYATIWRWNEKDSAKGKEYLYSSTKRNSGQNRSKALITSAHGRVLHKHPPKRLWIIREIHTPITYCIRTQDDGHYLGCGDSTITRDISLFPKTYIQDGTEHHNKRWEIIDLRADEGDSLLCNIRSVSSGGFLEGYKPGGKVNLCHASNEAASNIRVLPTLIWEKEKHVFEGRDETFFSFKAYSSGESELYLAKITPNRCGQIESVVGLSDSKDVWAVDRSNDESYTC